MTATRAKWLHGILLAAATTTGLALAASLQTVAQAMSTHPGIGAIIGGAAVAGLAAALGAAVRTWSA